MTGFARIGCVLLCAWGTWSTIATEKMNVLFIAVDDLRPELGCYGSIVKSPNIDRLAAEGTLFNRAYCQQAVCNPSRASLMTALRPESTGVTDLPTFFRDKRPNAVTVAEYFKNNGYHSERLGKIFHTGHGNKDDKRSWSRQKKYPYAPRYGPEGLKILKKARSGSTKEERAARRKAGKSSSKGNGPPYEAPNVADNALTDGKNAESAIKLMRELKDKPFFLAVGFSNPHLPFVAPKKYWDLYKPADIKPAANNFPPKNAPAYAVTNFGELRKYYGIPKKGPLSAEQEKKMVHGYYAAVSYVDAQVGLLLQELDRLNLRKKTVVILWGDHGWHLRDHGQWCKHTNYEIAARAPLILSIPGQPNKGAKTNALVEFVDIYPTLAEACGLPAPKGLEGISMMPVVKNPKRPWKKAAFHVYPRYVKGKGKAMGYAIRTERYRLVEWRFSDPSKNDYELYDLQKDPQENESVHANPEYAPVRQKLLGMLKAGWKAALPE